MTAGIEAITLLTPVIATNALFAPRRLSKGFDAIDDKNTIYGLANMDIAAGQTLKGIKAGTNLVARENVSAYEMINNLNSKVSTVAGKHPFLKNIGKVVEFTSNNINPIIYLTGGIKVLSSDDKKSTLIQEGLGILTMRIFEVIANSILGMPKFIKDKVTGKMISENRVALYHKIPCVDKLTNSIKTKLSSTNLFNKIPLKSAPSILKGIAFVLASICGYQLGSKIGNKLTSSLIKDNKNNDTTNNKLAIEQSIENK